MPAAGWYHEGTTLRWWDGSAWGPTAPQGGYLQVGASRRNDSTLVVLSHVGFIIAAVILALVLRLTEGKKDEFARHHSTEALNFQLTFMLIWLVGIGSTMIATDMMSPSDDDSVSLLLVLPFLALFVVYAVGAAFAVMGAVQASRRQWWRYPLSIRFVRGARAKQ